MTHRIYLIIGITVMAARPTMPSFSPFPAAESCFVSSESRRTTGLNVDDEGAAAAVGRWTMTGGCAARTRQSATRPPSLARLESAWRFDVDGVIEGEPLVWDDRIVLSVRVAQDRRRLMVYALDDGRRLIESKIYRTSLPLEPVLGPGCIVFRENATTVSTLRIGYTKFFSGWRWRIDKPEARTISGPVMIGSDVFVRCGEDLVGLTYGRSGQRWWLRGKFRGVPSVRGRFVYMLEYDVDGNAFCKLITRRDGKRAAQFLVGHHEGRRPPASAAAHIVAGDHFVVVKMPLPVPAPTGETFDTTVLGVKNAARTEADFVFGFTTRGDIAFVGNDSTENVLIPVRSEGIGDGWVRVARPKTKNEPLAVHLAGSGFHDDLVPATSAMVAGRTAFIGSRGYRVNTDKVVRDAVGPVTAQVIPARGTLLLRHGEATLEAWRRPAAKASTAVQTAKSSPAKSPEFEKARALMNDGSIVRGRLTVDHAGGRVFRRLGQKTREYPLRRSLLVEDADGRPVAWSDATGLVRGLERIRTEARAEIATRALRRAVTSNDIALIEKAIEQAQTSGVAGMQVDRATKALARLRTRPKTVRKKALGDAEALLAGLRAKGLDAVWHRIVNLPRRTPLRLRIDVLRYLLRHHGDHSGAVDMVRSMLPAGVKPAVKDFRAIEWLDFIEAVDVTPIRLIAPAKAGAKPSLDQERLRLARIGGRVGAPKWRDDLIGIRSERLFIVTPLANPGRAARCLSLGELVCDTLEKMFAEGAVKRDQKEPLVLVLYESREEYNRQSTRRGMAHAEFTLGHFSPAENVSRLFLPADEDGFEDVMNTFAHELTHHWLFARCPLFSGADAARFSTPGAARQAGFWIVEGFASLIEEFDFDLRSRTAITDPRRSGALDVVAHAEGKQITSWTDLFRVSQASFQNLPQQPAFSVPTRLYLGQVKRLSRRRMFYDQSTSMVWWLFHADGGKHRSKLIDFVGAYYSYSGKSENVDVEKHFGIAPTKLGRRVVQFAKKVSDR